MIGGSSVSGQSCIAAARELESKQTIISTTSGDKEVKGADYTIHGIKLDEPGAAKKILQHEQSHDIDYIVYIPARGQVGLRAVDATREMVDESINYCLRPALELSNKLKPKKTIMVSGFITMPPLLLVYGAMTYTKLTMEDLAVRYPKKLQMIRIGMFMSSSVRAIAVLVQRKMMKEKKEEFQDLYAEWKESGAKKFTEFFWQLNYKNEEEAYSSHSEGKPFRPTTDEDIKNGFKKALEGAPEPILNVLGPWSWADTKMVEIPGEVAVMKNLFPDDLHTYLED